MRQPLSALTRSQFVARSGLALAGATVAGLALDSPAGAGIEEDLALVRLAAAGELVAVQLYTRGLDSGLFAETERRDLKRALFNEQEHVGALNQALAAAGADASAGYGDFVYTFPAGTFDQRRRFGRVGADVERALVGAYLGAVQALDSPDLRIAAARIAACEAQHLAVAAGIAGESPLGVSFPPPLDIEQASDAFAPYLS